jgi:hypothetical protein
VLNSYFSAHLDLGMAGPQYSVTTDKVDNHYRSRNWSVLPKIRKTKKKTDWKPNKIQILKTLNRKPVSTGNLASSIGLSADFVVLQKLKNAIEATPPWLALVVSIQPTQALIL